MGDVESGYYIDADDDAGNPVDAQIILNGRTQVDPYITELQIETYGTAVLGNEEVFTFTQIVDMQYIVYTGFECISSAPGIQENPFEILLDNGGLLTGMAQRVLRDETINDIPTYVYEFDLDNIDPSDSAGAGVESIDIGLIYLDQEKLNVIRVYIEGRGNNELMSDGEAYFGDYIYQLDYFDFNVPIGEVNPPIGCGAADQSQSIETDWPLPADAANFQQLGAVITFSTNLTSEEVFDFYKTEMALLGCTLSQDLSADAGLITFDGCPGGAVSIVVQAGASGLMVSIVPLEQ